MDSFQQRIQTKSADWSECPLREGTPFPRRQFCCHLQFSSGNVKFCEGHVTWHAAPDKCSKLFGRVWLFACVWGEHSRQGNSCVKRRMDGETLLPSGQCVALSHPSSVKRILTMPCDVP